MFLWGPENVSGGPENISGGPENVSGGPENVSGGSDNVSVWHRKCFCGAQKKISKIFENVSKFF